jgi:hypothetical protein
VKERTHHPYLLVVTGWATFSTAVVAPLVGIAYFEGRCARSNHWLSPHPVRKESAIRSSRPDRLTAPTSSDLASADPTPTRT